jgi:hypothetical protein
MECMTLKIRSAFEIEFVILRESVSRFAIGRATVT